MPGVTAALVLGSIVPDADAALAARGFDLYLRAHASGTHSLPGTIGAALVLALVLRTRVRGSRFVTLLVAAWVGAVGHIVWDLADGSDMKVLGPFSDAVFGWHLVAMGDPLVLAVLAAAIVCAWRWPLRAQPIAVGAVVMLAVLLAAKEVSQTWARARYCEAVARGAPEPLEFAPEFGRLFAWTIYDRVGDRVRAWRVDSWLGTVSLAFERQDAPDSPVVATSRDLPIVKRFLALSKIPFVRVEDNGPHRLVLWSDVRSCSTTGCDLSFGGAFDATAPRYQLIEIGRFRQIRPLPSDRSGSTSR